MSNLVCIKCNKRITPADMKTEVCTTCGVRFAFDSQEEAEHTAKEYSQALWAGLEKKIQREQETERN